MYKAITSTVIAALLTLCVPAASLAATYNWKFAHEELAGGFMDEVAKEFAKRLHDKSKGAIKLDIFPSGTLGTSEDMVELLQSNVVQFNWADAGHVGTLVPEAQVLLLQYLFPKDLRVVQEVLQNGLFEKKLAPLFQNKNIMPLAYFSEGWQIWTSNKPLTKPEDFKGLKIRTMSSKLIVDNYKAYGANPTPIPFSEVYSSLQMNMVEGQENPAFVIHDMKFFEVQSHLTSGFCSPFVLLLATNNDFFWKLPEDIRKMVAETAIELVPFGFAWQEQYNKTQLESMLKQKPTLKVTYLDQNQMDAFAVKAKPVRESFFEMAPKHGPEVLKALEGDIDAAILKFR